MSDYGGDGTMITPQQTIKQISVWRWPCPGCQTPQEAESFPVDEWTQLCSDCRNKAYERREAKKLVEFQEHNSWMIGSKVVEIVPCAEYSCEVDHGSKLNILHVVVEKDGQRWYYTADHNLIEWVEVDSYEVRVEGGDIQ